MAQIKLRKLLVLRIKAADCSGIGCEALPAHVQDRLRALESRQDILQLGSSRGRVHHREIETTRPGIDLLRVNGPALAVHPDQDIDVPAVEQTLNSAGGWCVNQLINLLAHD